MPACLGIWTLGLRQRAPWLVCVFDRGARFICGVVVTGDARVVHLTSSTRFRYTCGLYVRLCLRSSICVHGKEGGGPLAKTGSPWLNDDLPCSM